MGLNVTLLQWLPSTFTVVFKRKLPTRQTAAPPSLAGNGLYPTKTLMLAAPHLMLPLTTTTVLPPLGMALRMTLVTGLGPATGLKSLRTIVLMRLMLIPLTMTTFRPVGRHYPLQHVSSLLGRKPLTTLTRLTGQCLLHPDLGHTMGRPCLTTWPPVSACTCYLLRTMLCLPLTLLGLKSRLLV